jgi:asparagine N-glycosylation enzyme membrane subunit Stt3
MKRLWSWTGAVFAVVHAAAFAALYIDYARRSGTWFADLPLSLAALPFTLVMRALNGGAFAFGGDMTERVIAAGVFGSALAYVAGWIVETVIRAIARLMLHSRASAS